MWTVQCYIGGTWIDMGDKTQFLGPAREILRTWEMLQPENKFRLSFKE